MAIDVPQLKDWKQALQEKLERVGNKRADIEAILEACADYVKEIIDIETYLQSQSAFVGGIRNHYVGVYGLLFGENPPNKATPPPPPEKTVPRNRKERVKVVHEASSAITPPGQEVSAAAVNNELIRRNIDLNHPNPNAVISTILNGWGEFEKVAGRKGVFKRKTHTEPSEASG